MTLVVGAIEILTVPAGLEEGFGPHTLALLSGEAICIGLVGGSVHEADMLHRTLLRVRLVKSAVKVFSAT